MKDTYSTHNTNVRKVWGKFSALNNGVYFLKSPIQGLQNGALGSSLGVPFER